MLKMRKYIGILFKRLGPGVIFGRDTHYTKQRLKNVPEKLKNLFRIFADPNEELLNYK